MDFLRAGVRVLAQAVMELEVTQHVGAEPYQRSQGSAPFRASCSLPGAHRPDLRRIRVRRITGTCPTERPGSSPVDEGRDGRRSTLPCRSVTRLSSVAAASQRSHAGELVSRG